MVAIFALDMLLAESNVVYKNIKPIWFLRALAFNASAKSMLRKLGFMITRLSAASDAASYSYFFSKITARLNVKSSLLG